VDKSSPLFGYLADNLDGKFWEVDAFNPDNYVVSIPVSMEGAILREKESAVELLERMKHVKKGWIDPGHVKGANTHNVSLTVNYKEDEKKAVKEWMWENRDVYNGISLLPYDDSSYVQMPFEEISRERYQELSKQFPVLSLGSVDYSSTVDERQGELACAGGSCELK
jgi:ribonucleoside-diphosphate reductase alpha chain